MPIAVAERMLPGAHRVLAPGRMPTTFAKFRLESQSCAAEVRV